MTEIKFNVDVKNVYFNRIKELWAAVEYIQENIFNIIEANRSLMYDSIYDYVLTGFKIDIHFDINTNDINKRYDNIMVNIKSE